jgi:hypothetical protein
MAGTGDPLTRERLAAYRRFIEELVETSSLKTTNYYVLGLWRNSAASPRKPPGSWPTPWKAASGCLS